MEKRKEKKTTTVSFSQEERGRMPKGNRNGRISTAGKEEPFNGAQKRRKKEKGKEAVIEGK